MDNFALDELSNKDLLLFTGTQINYYLVCKRKLWLFSHHIELEKESDLVKLGQILHEERYQKRLKEIQIDRIKIDFIENKSEIHEIKRSKKMENAYLFQLLYYIYFMKKNFNLIMRGVLNYPLLRKKIQIELTIDKEKELQEILLDIKLIIEKEKPPEPLWKNYCKSCAYRDLCWS